MGLVTEFNDGSVEMRDFDFTGPEVYINEHAQMESIGGVPLESFLKQHFGVTASKVDFVNCQFGPTRIHPDARSKMSLK